MTRVTLWFQLVPGLAGRLVQQALHLPARPCGPSGYGPQAGFKTLFRKFGGILQQLKGWKSGEGYTGPHNLRLSRELEAALHDNSRKTT